MVSVDTAAEKERERERERKRERERERPSCREGRQTPLVSGDCLGCCSGGLIEKRCQTSLTTKNGQTNERANGRTDAKIKEFGTVKN
jgi:hypothetical protein